MQPTPCYNITKILIITLDVPLGRPHLGFPNLTPVHHCYLAFWSEEPNYLISAILGIDCNSVLLPTLRVMIGRGFRTQFLGIIMDELYGGMIVIPFFL